MKLASQVDGIKRRLRVLRRYRTPPPVMVLREGETMSPEELAAAGYDPERVVYYRVADGRRRQEPCKG